MSNTDEPEIAADTQEHHSKEFSNAGIQVPAGTVDEGESLESAVVRELAEEVGVGTARIARKVDEYILYRVPHFQFNRRHAFLLMCDAKLPDEWMHRVSGGGCDDGLMFRCHWLPIDHASRVLAGGLGDSLWRI